MIRAYQVTSTMLTVPYSNMKVVEPDKNLVQQLHKMLDIIPDDNLALGIDHVVAQLISFHDPNRQHYMELLK